MPPPTVSLATYRSRVRELLHDPNDQYWSLADKDTYINEGLQQRDLDTAGNRQLFSFDLTAARDTYTFNEVTTRTPAATVTPSAIGAIGATVTCTASVSVFVPTDVGKSIVITAGANSGTEVRINQFTSGTSVTGVVVAVAFVNAAANASGNWQIQMPPGAAIFDLVGINLLYSGLRIVLGQTSFTELNAYFRQYAPPYQWLPLVFARYGPNQVVVAPAPSIAYTTEWDCCCYSETLAAASDTDALPYPYTQPVPFYAAYKAKLARRQFDEAEQFLALYRQKALTAVSARTGIVPSMYPGMLQGRW